MKCTKPVWVLLFTNCLHILVPDTSMVCVVSVGSLLRCDSVSVKGWGLVENEK